MADGKKPPRLQSPTERELDSDRARRERAATPEELFDDVTGNYEGEELQAMRGKRSPEERLDRLEVKHDVLAKDVSDTRVAVGKLAKETRDRHDALVKDVTETRVLVGEMRGEMRILPEMSTTQRELVSIVKGVAQSRSDREHVTFTQKIDLDTAKAKSSIAVAEAEQIDVIKARSERRKRITKIVGAIVGMPALWELAKWLAGKL